MATLDGINVNHAGTVKTPDGFNIDVWSVRLSGEASDTFTVPGVTTTNGSAILLKGLGEDPVIPGDPGGADSRTAAQASITVAAAVRAEGDSTVTVTNSASPRRQNRVIITTLRQRVGVNNATIDEDPT